MVFFENNSISIPHIAYTEERTEMNMGAPEFPDLTPEEMAKSRKKLTEIRMRWKNKN